MAIIQRSNPTQYDAPTKNPASGSVYAFLVTGFAIADGEPQLPDWMPPFAVQTGTSRYLRAFIERSNARRAWFERDLVDSFIGGLRLTSIDPNELAPPYSPAVRALLSEHLRAKRAALAAKEPFELRRYDRSLDDVSYRHELAVRVINAARFMLNISDDEPAPPRDTLRYLNEGRRGDEAALTRHSLRSVWRTFHDELAVDGRARLYRMAEDVSRLSALEYLRQEAKRDARFRQFHGEELALRIHETVDLNEALWRAARHLRRTAQSAA